MLPHHLLKEIFTDAKLFSDRLNLCINLRGLMRVIRLVLKLSAHLAQITHALVGVRALAGHVAKHAGLACVITVHLQFLFHYVNSITGPIKCQRYAYRPLRAPPCTSHMVPHTAAAPCTERTISVRFPSRSGSCGLKATPCHYTYLKASFCELFAGSLTVSSLTSGFRQRATHHVLPQVLSLQLVTFVLLNVQNIVPLIS